MSIWDQLDPFRMGWLVGLIEGEGCVLAPTPTRKGVKVQINMTDKDTIELIASIFGTKAGIKDYSFIKTGHQPQYRACVSGKKALQLIQDIYPYMSGRRQKAIERATGITLGGNPLQEYQLPS